MKPSKLLTENQPIRSETDKPKVLVVDDSRLVRVTIRKLLRDEFEVLEAVDGEDGWDIILKNQDLKVILTDAGMPRLDGYELISRVRAFSDTVINKLPMVLITGAEVGQTELRQKALELGASDFIIKPFDKAQMIARVRSYVKQDELQRELKSTERNLATHATIDPLSKLNNLRYFLRRVTQELAMAERHHASLSLLGIRIDNPERIRDSHGDKTLEKIILWTVNSLSPLLRKEDILTHTNKCEFIVIAPATNRMSAAIFGERVRKNLLQKKYLETTLTIPVSVSMGLINNISDEMGDAEISLQLLRNRLQKAQDLGGNRICASDKVARTPAIRKKVQIDKQEALRSALLSLTSDISSDNYIDIAKIAKKLLPLLDQVNQGLHLDLAEYVVAFRQKIAKHID